MPNDLFFFKPQPPDAAVVAEPVLSEPAFITTPKRLNIEIFSRVVDRLLQKTIERDQDKPILDASFTMAAPSPLSVEQYIHRIMVYWMKSEATCICMLILLSRYLQKNPDQHLHERNIYFLLAFSALIANKVQNDDCKENIQAIEVFGFLYIHRFNELEIKFLLALDFCLFISHQEYVAFFQDLLDFSQNEALVFYDEPQAQVASHPEPRP